MRNERKKAFIPGDAAAEDKSYVNSDYCHSQERRHSFSRESFTLRRERLDRQTENCPELLSWQEMSDARSEIETV